jgi:16S rRNA (guanine527-N7)-methyltransferase
LALRYELPRPADDQLLALLDLVSGDEQAPTSVREPEGVLRDHLADSLVALELTEVRGASSIADLGAGAGFPGLPLAIASSTSSVTLVESSTRKCRFIERAIAACRLTNAAVVHSRAEEWGAGAGRLDLVTARALAPLDVVAEYAAPLLRIGGSVVIWRGRRDPDAEERASRAARHLGLEPRLPIAMQPYPGALHRHLHSMVKVEPTPPGFPRRPGMAAKRPLGERV